MEVTNTMPPIGPSVPSDARLERREPGGPYPILLLSVIATVAMLFAAFTAALLIRRAGQDWAPVALPPVAWVNLLFLFASSAAVERARAAARDGESSRVSQWLGAAMLLGGLFLAGQVGVWRELVLAGVFLPSNPHASFFYMLSAVHGAHVVGGLGALLWILRRFPRQAPEGPRRVGLSHAAVFWHFVGAIWLYLMVLLTLA